MQDRKLRESEQRRKDIIKVVRKLIKTGGTREITLRKVAELAKLLHHRRLRSLPGQGHPDHPGHG
ncbi:hypothetical protein LP420_07005 [Massilia sp. B-10]|nr:hypothetical protein LP420_07005 [Massilia sp. B-10]